MKSTSCIAEVSCRIIVLGCLVRNAWTTTHTQIQEVQRQGFSPSILHNATFFVDGYLVCTQSNEDTLLMERVAKQDTRCQARQFISQSSGCCCNSLAHCSGDGFPDHKAKSSILCSQTVDWACIQSKDSVSRVDNES